MATPPHQKTQAHPGSSNTEPKLDQSPTLDLLQAIMNGQVDPSSLSGHLRLGCVEVIRASGRSVAEIAKILKIGERTVKRDLKLLRKSQAQALTPQYINEQRGELLRYANLAFQGLLALANAKDTPARVKQSALSTIAMASTVGTRDLDALELEKARSGCGAPDTSASSPADPPVSLEDAQKEIDRLHEIALKLQRSRSLPGKSKDNAGGEAA